MPKNFLRRYASKAALLGACALFASSCTAFHPAKEQTPWGTYLGGEARGNVSTDPVSMPLVKVWDKDIAEFTAFKGYSNEQLASPAISGGVLFIGSPDKTFYAMEMATGKVLWKFDAKYQIEAPATVTDDKVCFGSSDGFLRCLDREGKLLWEYRAKSEILSSPVIRDAKVYFSSSDDRLYALDAATGEKVWNYTRRVFKTVVPRLYASSAWDHGRLYHLFSDGTLVCLSAADGKELWTRKLVDNFDGAQSVRRTPLVSGGVVYAIDDKNAVVALSAETGDVKGIYNIIKANDFVLPDRDTLVIAGADRMVSIKISTGELNWDKHLTNSPTHSIFAAGDYLLVLANKESTPFKIYFFTSTEGYVEALKIADGSTVWTKKLDSAVSAGGAASAGAVALASDSGGLTLFTSR